LLSYAHACFIFDMLLLYVILIIRMHVYYLFNPRGARTYAYLIMGTS
jgi:hypothetical protein